MAVLLTPTDLHISTISQHLRAGKIAAIPTETVYGLAANATCSDAVIQIYQAKDRPQFNPLISHYSSLSSMEQDVVIDTRVRSVAERFWPGPLTLVLPKTPHCRLADITTAGLPTAAVRVPAHSATHALLSRLPFPLAAPSANPSGQLSPTSAQHVEHAMGTRLEYILDGGACERGIESTILDLSTTRPTLLRYGSITKKQLEALLGDVDDVAAHEHTGTTTCPKAPGMLLRHYTPRTPLRMGVENPAPGEALLGFGDIEHIRSHFDIVMNLSTSSDFVEASRNLFAFLHQLDERSPSRIAVSPIPDTGLGRALNDRLRRAAQPHS